MIPLEGVNARVIAERRSVLREARRSDGFWLNDEGRIVRVQEPLLDDDAAREPRRREEKAAKPAAKNVMSIPVTRKR